MKHSDGDLLNIENVKYFITKYNASFDIVCSDGALKYDDTITDKDNVEVFVPKEFQHTKLFLTECITILGTQKLGGSSFIKLYTFKENVTKQIFYMMSKYYKEIELYKPKSVRIANKETFIICKEFTGISKLDLNRLINQLSIILSTNEYLYNFIESNLIFNDKEIDNFHNYLEKIEIFTHEMGLNIILSNSADDRVYVGHLSELNTNDQINFAMNKFVGNVVPHKLPPF